MNPFVNTHTHHLGSSKDVVLLNNRFAFDKELNTENYFSLGIHPWDVHMISPQKMNEFERLIQSPNCLAIGECGLDKVCKSDYRQQKYFFSEQLKLAVKYQKPVIIHCVKAFDDLLGICKPYLNKIPLIIHGFNKNDELAKQLINKGFYLSVSNEFLSKTKLSKEILNKLFLETDDKMNISIQDVYKIASEKLLVNDELLKEKIYTNFAALFKVNN